MLRFSKVGTYELHMPAAYKVINCAMPATLKQYIHRVGRTARAGKAGRYIWDTLLACFYAICMLKDPSHLWERKSESY